MTVSDWALWCGGCPAFRLGTTEDMRPPASGERGESEGGARVLRLTGWREDVDEVRE